MAMTKCRECGKRVSDAAAMCPSCGIQAPAPAADPDKTKHLAFAIAGFVGLIMLGKCVSGDSPQPATRIEAPPTADVIKAQQAAEAVARQKLEAEAAACSSQRLDIAAAYATDLRAKRYDEAADRVRACASNGLDSSFAGMLRNAEFLDLRAQAVDKTKSRGERQLAIDLLRSKYPEDAIANTQFYINARQAIEREEAAEKRKQGVRVGMTEQDVLASSWGKPRKINRTTSARGTREQWVYDGGYLYFEDGVLTAIQN